ncbi:MAG: chemotaxis protein CheX [Leptospiraceae bacterium]|nr:chemotaxis protein CheX [Leptospiraceae bacterium]
MNLSIKVFVQALNKTLKDMGDIDLVNEEIEEFHSTEFHSDFTCSIGIVEAKERSSLILSLDDIAKEKIVFSITQKLNPQKSLVYDTIGELLNIIVGIAQKESSVKFDFSLPVSIIGKNHLVHLIHNEKSKRAISKLDDGKLGLYLSYAQILNA